MHKLRKEWPKLNLLAILRKQEVKHEQMGELVGIHDNFPT